MRLVAFIMNQPVAGVTLLLGEGDFSFSVAFTKKLHSSAIVSTCLLNEKNLYETHKSAQENVSKLKERGVDVHFEVDATKLGELDCVGDKKFRRVIFNFPHTGGKSNIKNNRKLLTDFFASVGSILEPGGDVCITLCQGQGGTPLDKPIREWHDSWQVVAMAAISDFVPVDIQPFKTSDYEEYSCTGFRSLDRHFYIEGSMTHFFQWVPSLKVEPKEHTLSGGIITDQDGKAYHTLKYLANKYGKKHIYNLQHPIGLVTKKLQASINSKRNKIKMLKGLPSVISEPTLNQTGGHVYDVNAIESSNEQDIGTETVGKTCQLRTTMFDSLRSLHVCTDPAGSDAGRNLLAREAVCNQGLICVGDVFRRPSSYTQLDLPVQHEMVGLVSHASGDPMAEARTLIMSCVSEVVENSHIQVCVTAATDLPAQYKPYFVVGGVSAIELVFTSQNKFYENACNQVVERGKPDAKRKLEKICKVSREIGYIGRPSYNLDCTGANDTERYSFVIILDHLAMIKYDIPDARGLWSERIISQFAAEPVRYKPLSCFPPLWRHDLSFWDSDTQEFEESKLHDVIREVAGDLVKCVLLQSVWPEPKTGRLSRCYRQVHQSADQAVCHAAAHDIQNAIRLTVAKELGVTLR